MFKEMKDVPLKFNSMFLRTVLVLCMLLAANGIVFWYFINKQYQEKIIQKQSASGFYSMAQYGSELSSRLSEGMSMMDSIFQDQNCRRLIMSGNDLPDNEYAAVMHELASLVTDAGFFDSALIYLLHTDQVLMSDRTIKDAASSGMESVLSSGTSGLVADGDKLYLCRVYPAKKPVAVMVCQVNPKGFYSSIGINNFPGTGISRIFVYDRDGFPLFAGNMKYPEEKDLVITGEVSGLSDEANCRTFRSGSDYILSYEDKANNLIYLQFIDGSTGFTPQEVLPTMIIFMIFAVMMLIGASYYLSDRVFKPFQQAITELISRKDIEKIEEIQQSSNNELELIKNIARDDVRLQQRHLEMMQTARWTIIGAVMSELIYGVGRSRTEIREIIRDVESPFSEKGRYLVMVYYSEPFNMETAVPLKEEMLRLEMDSSAEEFWKDKALVLSLPSRDRHHFIVFCLRDGGDYSEDMKSFLEKVREKLSAVSQVTSVGISNEGNSLFDLQELAEEALDDMRRRIYYAEDSEQNAAAGYGDSDVQAEAMRAFERLTGRATAETYADDPEKIHELLRNIADSHTEDAGSIFEALMDLMTERMIQVHIPISEQAQAVRDSSLTGGNIWTRNDRRIDDVCSFLDACLGEYYRASNNDKFRYVDNAIKLIHERYYDNTLSLESISSELGLSPQYMSRLFASRQNDGFLAYLNRYRLDRAKEMLEHTNYSISDIGLKTGFNSAQSFIRVFKRYENMTPGQFRKLTGGKGNDSD